MLLSRGVSIIAIWSMKIWIIAGILTGPLIFIWINFRPIPFSFATIFTINMRSHTDYELSPRLPVQHSRTPLPLGNLRLMVVAHEPHEVTCK